jgi:phage-related protein
MPAAVVAIGAVIGGVAGAVAAAVGPIAAAISATLGPIVASVTSIVAGIAGTISAAVGALATQVTNAVGPLVTSLKAGIAKIVSAITTATAPILQPLADALGLISAKLKAVDAWLVAELAIVHDAIQVASAAATVKLLVDLVKGTAGISDVIGKVAEGKGFETAVAIARLTKSIATLGVGVVDRIDEHWNIIEAEIKTWPETFGRELDMQIEQEKAEILSLMTPKIVEVGRYQERVTREVAALWRHIEDESWFAYMLVRALR